jgi:hypothetical protein
LHKKISQPLTILFGMFIIFTSFGAITVLPQKSNGEVNDSSFGYINYNIKSNFSPELPSAITVSDNNPFYALIATPLAVRYDNDGNQFIAPLYLKNLTNPSKAIIRAEQQVGIYTDFTIGDTLSPKDISLFVADMFWDDTTTALVIKDDKSGYNLGIVATPIASYLGIPVIVTDAIDHQVEAVLDDLGVTTLYVCGNLHTSSYWVKEFENTEEIIEECMIIIDHIFGDSIQYITIANPLDVNQPKVLDKIIYEFSGNVGSMMFLPTQTIGMLFNDQMKTHRFDIPADYKYAKLNLDLKNENPENAERLGDKVSVILASPDGPRYFFVSTDGGLPVRDMNGDIIEDKIHYEIALYDKPGNYGLQVLGQWGTQKVGSYEAIVTIEKIESPVVPLMKGLSSIAPYLTAYHKGIVFAKPEFAFAADYDVLNNGEPCPGVTQPGSNPLLVEPSNAHTMQIHQELNNLLAEMVEIPTSNLQGLRNYYYNNPIYIAIAADPTMVPMYFYYNPDGRLDAKAYMMGFALPSDFMWGDIDPKPDDPENNSFSPWPSMENMVGRVTGRDVQDCSALIARTIFYNNIIEKMDDWKDTALVQTGCGLEFQNLPIVTKLSQMLFSGRGEPTKFPTGESTFINLRLKEKMEEGYTNVKNTFLLESQREGFTEDELKDIKNAGILNRLLFPEKFIELLMSDEKVTGGKLHLDSSLIFTFAHGSFNLFEHGDIFIDSRGFPFVTAISRIYPQIRSGLSSKGSYSIRSIENMEYGPSVVFVESCITGRTDGIPGENVLSQTFIHAGVNAYIGATRVTADPGYLEPRPLPGGVGLGILGLMKAMLDLKLYSKYPDLHFGAVIAEDFINELIGNDATTGLALRNAKNVYLEKDANSTFLWTPPLSFSTGNSIIDQLCLSSLNLEQTNGNARTRVLDKKYVALHEFTLYGDPAFNPYQSVNEG